MNWIDRWKPYFGRLLGVVLGLVTAILFMVLGFAKTMLILFCCGVGYMVGLYKDKDKRLPERLWFWRGRWR